MYGARVSGKKAPRNILLLISLQVNSAWLASVTLASWNFYTNRAFEGVDCLVYSLFSRCL